MLEPDTDALRRAGGASLVRHPDTPAAKAFAADTLNRMAPHLARRRPLGVRGSVAMLTELGIVLAGVMRPGLQGMPVRVHQSAGGKMWDRRRGAQPIGHRRYWAILDALKPAATLASSRAKRSLEPRKTARSNLLRQSGPPMRLRALRHHMASQRTAEPMIGDRTPSYAPLKPPMGRWSW